MLTLDVVEGEKCAEALGALGLLATTSQGGSGRAAETDWAPAALCDRVRLWEDVDASDPETGKNPGVTYTQTAGRLILAAALAGGTPAPQIVVVNLRPAGLVDGQDVFDFIAGMRQDGKDDAAIVAGLEAAAGAYGKPWALVAAKGTGLNGETSGTQQPGAISLDAQDQPEPLGPAPRGREERDALELGNFTLIKRPNPKFGKKDEPEFILVPQKVEIDTLRERLNEITGEWPARVRSPGARNPLLFADIGGGNGLASVAEEVEENESAAGRLLQGRGGLNRIRWLSSSDQFRAWLHERSRPMFHDKLDCDRANFVSIGDLYHSLGGCEDVNEFKAVEVRPHVPRMRGHYYAWTETGSRFAVPGSRLDGDLQALKGLIKFFDNCEDRASVAILVAAVLTPGWGGPYGKRPSFVITAPDRGYGKSTIAEMISKIWGGHISINYESRNDDELYQRLLSTDALVKRCAIVDNVKGAFNSSTIEQLITEPQISGKRLYTGEASRPNIMTYFITANGVRLSRDMASRSYCVSLKKPAYRASWDEDVAAYIFENMEAIIRDCCVLLSANVKSTCSRPDRWGPWVANVLCRACDFLGDITPDQVMEATAAFREECDDDLEEARLLESSVVEELAKQYTYSDTAGRMQVVHSGGPTEPVFVSSTTMTELFKKIMSKPKLGTKQVNNIITEHAGAGRLQHFQYKRTASSNGYEVAAEPIRDYLGALSKRMEQKQAERDGDPSDSNEGETGELIPQ